MTAQVFCVKPEFVEEDEVYEMWCLTSIDIIKDGDDRFYLDFEWNTIDGIHKEVRYSELTNMFYGIEEYDLTLDDLEILIKFINLQLYELQEFRFKVYDSNTTYLKPEYIYKNLY